MTIMNNAPKSPAKMPPVAAQLSDMDGVLVKENRALPGANEFLDAFCRTSTPFPVLTSNSISMNRGPSARLTNSSLDVPGESTWTSANATAAFLARQSPRSTAYVIGKAGLTTALHGVGYVMIEQDPEYVVLGETRTYDFNSLARAIRLIEGGVRFIATNPDVTGSSDEGTLPATGPTTIITTVATGKRPYFVGKPNPVMICAGLNKIGAHSEHTAMVDDYMDTDVQAGVETGLYTHLALSGSTSRKQIKDYPYYSFGAYEGIGELVELIKAHIG